MGWTWIDENSDNRDLSNCESASGERVSTKKVVKSQCRTEEVEPGKFIKKCEKTEEILRNSVGRTEVLQSSKEYTVEDVTDEVLKGRAFESSVLNNPVQRDIEDMERHLLNSIFGIDRFFKAAEGISKGFLDVLEKSPRIFDAESSSPPSSGQEIPIEGYREEAAFPKSETKKSTSTSPSPYTDFDGMAKDV